MRKRPDPRVPELQLLKRRMNTMAKKPEKGSKKVLKGSTKVGNTKLMFEYGGQGTS